MRIGFVTALAREAATLRAGPGRLRDDAEYLVRCAGPGQARAGAAAEQCLADGCDALVSWGVAGALVPGFEPGALVLVERVFDADGAGWDCDDALRTRLAGLMDTRGPRRARLASVAAPVVEAAAKDALAIATGCALVDMESAAVARLASRHGAAFAVVRSVVDPAGFSLPAAALAGMRDDGSVAAFATCAALLRHPGELSDLLRLARWFGRATRSLERAARALGA